MRLFREEELLENRRDRDRLLDTDVVGFCRIDADQNVVAWNEGAERLLGWKATDVLGHHVPIATEQSRRAGGVPERCAPRPFHRKSGNEAADEGGPAVEVALSAVPLFDSTGGVHGEWLTLGDQRDRKRSERLLDVQKRVTSVIARANG